MVKITISENQGNQRLDRFLKKYLDNAPLSMLYKMIRKDIKVNGKRAKEDTMVNVGDELCFYLSEEEIKKLQREKKTVRVKRQFKIAYEDENILIAEKPFGLLTHGDSTEKKNHLLNQVIDYLIEKGEYNPRIDKTFTPAAVNRLDRNTTGLVLFGKNASALQELSRMIREKECISKRYQTIVSGKLDTMLMLRDMMVKDDSKNVVRVFSEKDSVSEKNIEGSSKRKDTAFDEKQDRGKLMETIVKPLKSGKISGRWFSLVEVEIITGRTHQIRAHLKQAGYPVIGDVKYGDRETNQFVRSRYKLNTQLLHAYRLEFCSVPEGKLSYLEGKTVMCPLPQEFEIIERDMK